LDLIPRRYRLEVSSPGVDRLLSRDRDFVRFQGSRIEVNLQAPQGDDPEYPLGPRRNFTGRLVAYDMAEGVLSLETEAGLLRIPRSWISRARLSPELPMPRKKKRDRWP
jgi:ribosome maturation factor RimP